MKTRSAMPTTSSQSKKSISQENETSFSPNWPQIIKWSIIIVVVLGISKVLLQLFVAAGPLFRGLEDILGAGANVVEGLTNGCSSQPDCKQTKDANVCKNQDNCGWNPPTQGGEEGNCINLSGRKSGSGGFLSASCGLGIGAILYTCGLLFSGIITLLAARYSKNANVETAGRLNGKGTAETLKIVVEDSRTATEEIKAESEEPLTDDQIELTAKQAANSSSTNEVMRSITDQQDAEKIANDAIESHAEIDAEIIKDAKDKGFSDDDIKSSEDDVDKHIEPFEVMAINKMILLNIKPTKKAHAHLYRRTLKKPVDKIPQHHMNFLLKSL